MATIYTVEGNTSGGSTLVANGGGVAKKSYPSNYSRIACIWRPQYKSDEALKVIDSCDEDRRKELYKEQKRSTTVVKELIVKSNDF